ncbi:uncharacterized protein TNCV_2926941 [Trichonephila clavipes]|nr:uncharacterized protein TNCV_2926941 [Trichonephila clavipes]
MHGQCPIGKESWCYFQRGANGTKYTTKYAGLSNDVLNKIKPVYLEICDKQILTSRVARDKPWSTLCKKSHGIPSSPRAAAVAKFRLLTGHDCLCAHLFRFNLVTSPICVLCDTGQDMTAAHLDECSALNDLNCIVKSSPPGGTIAYQLLHRLINLQVANMVAKNDANLALSPTFCHISIESPL